MKSVRYLYALLLSNETPLFKAVADDRGVDAAKGNKLRIDLFGIKHNSMQAWLTSKNGPKKESIDKMCAHFNALRETDDVVKKNSTEIIATELYFQTPSDNDDGERQAQGHDAAWFEFSKKLGYKIGGKLKPTEQGWRDVQSAIETVLYSRNVRGHEMSCEVEGLQAIKEDFEGINYLYFISRVSIRRSDDGELEKTNALIRATLRIRTPVKAANTNSVKYVPARLKFSTPEKNGKKWRPVEYVGQATFKDRFLYLALVDDSTGATDYVHIAIDSRSSNNIFGGIYTSVSGKKTPYASAVVLENREHQLKYEAKTDEQSNETSEQNYEVTDGDDPKATLDFMYGNSDYFLSANGEHPSTLIHSIVSLPPEEDEHFHRDRYIGLTEKKKIDIEKLLERSPFYVDVRFLKDS